MVSEESAPPSAEELLRHRSFLEQLVGRLIPDPQAAEDVVQETWLRALQNPPRRRRNLEPWLHTLASNLARSRWRRRRVEEAAVDGERLRTSEPAPSAALEAQRAELRRVTVEEVLALREPYRGVVLAVFLHGHGVAEVAERLGRPPNTVQSQLQRAIEQLHERLTRRLGEEDLRVEWLLLAVLDLRSGPGSATAPDAVAPGRQRFATRIALLAVPAVGAAIYFGLLGGASPPPRVGVTESARTPAPATPETPRGIEDAPLPHRDRSPLGGPGGAESKPASPPATRREPGLRVTVLDAQAQPLPGAHVSILSEAPDGPAQSTVNEHAGISDAAGRVTIELLEEHRVALPFRPNRDWIGLIAHADGYAAWDITYVPFSEDGSAVADLRLRDRGFTLHGVVRDSAGSGVAAWVQVGTVRPHVVEESEDRVVVRMAPTVRCGADGRYAIEGLVRERHPIQVQAEGFAPFNDWIDFGGADVEEFSVVLGGGNTLSGFVDVPGGTPEGATIRVEYEATWRMQAFLERQTRSDRTGAFRLAGLPDGRAWIWARAADDPTRVAGRWANLEDGAGLEWRAVLEPDPGLSIVLLDPAGRPLAEHLVKLTTPSRTWWRRQATDADGETVFRGVPPGDLTAVVYASWDAHLASAVPLQEFGWLRPAQDAYVLTVETAPPELATLTGAVVAYGDRPLPECKLLVGEAGAGTLTERALRADGSFALTTPPGEIELFLYAEPWGLTPLRTLALEPAQALDLGQLDLPPLSRLSFDGPSTATDEHERFRLTTRGVRAATIDSGPLTSIATYDVFPGRYLLELTDAAGRVLALSEIEVELQEDTAFALPD